VDPGEIPVTAVARRGGGLEQSDRRPAGRLRPRPLEPTAVKLSMVILTLATCLALAACGGESKQQQASSQVCDARADIKKQVDELSGLTLSTASIDGVKSNLTAIKNDLGKMKDAQGNLNDERKQQVSAANQAFGAQVNSLAQSVGGSLSITEAVTQLKTAASQLSATYKQTLGKIDCGS